MYHTITVFYFLNRFTQKKKTQYSVKRTYSGFLAASSRRETNPIKSFNTASLPLSSSSPPLLSLPDRCNSIDSAHSFKRVETSGVIPSSCNKGKQPIASPLKPNPVDPLYVTSSLWSSVFFKSVVIFLRSFQSWTGLEFRSESSHVQHEFFHKDEELSRAPLPIGTRSVGSQAFPFLTDLDRPRLPSTYWNKTPRRQSADIVQTRHSYHFHSRKAYSRHCAPRPKPPPNPSGQCPRFFEWPDPTRN
jgi:hypothetical protein